MDWCQVQETTVRPSAASCKHVSKGKAQCCRACPTAGAGGRHAGSQRKLTIWSHLTLVDQPLFSNRAPGISVICWYMSTPRYSLQRIAQP